MKKGKLEFVNKYREKLSNDKIIAMNNELENGGVYFYRRDVGAISFHLHCISRPNGESKFTDLIELDSEDVKYLYDKYSKQLDAEMRENIEEVKRLYGDSPKGGEL
jgi:hypothetical protein